MTDRQKPLGRRAKWSSPDGGGRPQLRASSSELVERVEKLVSLRATFASETGAARREAARLRLHNETLQRRVDELETHFELRDARSEDA
jgi:phage shock protein A